MEIYGFEFKKNLLSEKIKMKQTLKSEHLTYTIQGIKKSKLREWILSLPQDIQKSIFIFSMKKYWKRDTLSRKITPLWQSHSDHVMKEKKKSILDNVHFLHLEFNTLPENKKYILGCQCDFCKQYMELNIDKYMSHVFKYSKDPGYFLNHIQCRFNDNDWNAEYTIFVDKDNEVFSVVQKYDPLYDLACERPQFTQRTIEDYNDLSNIIVIDEDYNDL